MENQNDAGIIKAKDMGEAQSLVEQLGFLSKPVSKAKVPKLKQPKTRQERYKSYWKMRKVGHGWT